MIMAQDKLINMKKISIFFILICFHLFSQNKSGKITYNVNLGFDEGFSNSETLKDFYEKARLGVKNITFSLLINSENSLFTMNDMISNEDINFAKAFIEASTIYYTNIKTNNNIKQINNHLGKYVINYSAKTEWILENESKMIGTYLCYKATSELRVKNRKGEFKYPIIAWYCPSIPFNFGPKGYYGLPGLILELQERNTSYGVIKIDLKKENTPIGIPNEGKVVTQEEFNEIVSKPPTF